MGGQSSTIQIPVTTYPASLTGTGTAPLAPARLGAPPQPVTTAAAQINPFHNVPDISAAPPAPTPSVTLAPVSFFAPWLPAHTSTTTVPPIMTTTNAYPQLTGLMPASTTSFVAYSPAAESSSMACSYQPAWSFSVLKLLLVESQRSSRLVPSHQIICLKDHLHRDTLPLVLQFSSIQLYRQRDTLPSFPPCSHLLHLHMLRAHPFRVIRFRDTLPQPLLFLTQQYQLLSWCRLVRLKVYPLTVTLHL